MVLSLWRSMMTFFSSLTRAGAWLIRTIMRGASLRSFLAALFLAPLPALAIVGPAREAPAFAPYVVVVLTREGGGASFCSASVITSDTILTAAHCVTNPRDTFIRLPDENGEPSLRATAEIAIHPGYRRDAARQQLLSIDLALVRLAEPLPAQFQPVAFAEPGSEKPGQIYQIVGFGISEEDGAGTGGVLREGRVIATGQRSSTLVWLRDPYDAGLGACTGDSGAPVFVLGTSRLVAVAVWAKGDGMNRCGALTQAVLVAPQLDWIESVLRSWVMAGARWP
jgi:hypothetical protein